MLIKTYCASVMGLETMTITIELNMTRGVQFHLTGLPDMSVKESMNRIRAALSNNGYRMPVADLSINMSPSDVRKEGCGYDLPLAIGILAVNGSIESEELGRFMMVGE